MFEDRRPRGALGTIGGPILSRNAGSSGAGRIQTPNHDRRIRRRRSITALLLAVLMMAGFIPSASAAVTSISFAKDIQAAGLGEPFAEELEVTVTDGSGPVEGVEVAFSVRPDFTGATVQLSATVAVTGTDGTARVSATAGSTPGFALVLAQAEGVVAHASLVIRPPGYLPGEQLASIEGLDQNDVSQTIGGKLRGKQPFLLIDVCAGWCVPFRTFAAEAQEAIAQLALLGVDARLVTLLADGDIAGRPSTRLDAQNWASSNDLSGPVLHAAGSQDSPLYRSASFLLHGVSLTGAPEGFPTHLLVDPNGVILDRRVGAETAQQTIARVLEYATPKKPKNVKETIVGEVGVRLPGGDSYRHQFRQFGVEFLEWGVVLLDGSDSGDSVSRTWLYQTPDVAPLPPEGPIELSLTRFKSEQGQRLVAPTVQVQAAMLLGDPQDPDNLDVIVASTTVPAAQQKGTVTVPIDLVALRSAMRSELEAGRYRVAHGQPPAELTPELIDDLVASMPSVEIRADYVP